jgi:hypothetical protein
MRHLKAWGLFLGLTGGVGVAFGGMVLLGKLFGPGGPFVFLGAVTSLLLLWLAYVMTRD